MASAARDCLQACAPSSHILHAAEQTLFEQYALREMKYRHMYKGVGDWGRTLAPGLPAAAQPLWLAQLVMDDAGFYRFAQAHNITPVRQVHAAAAVVATAATNARRLTMLAVQGYLQRPQVLRLVRQWTAGSMTLNYEQFIKCLAEMAITLFSQPVRAALRAAYKRFSRRSLAAQECHAASPTPEAKVHMMLFMLDPTNKLFKVRALEHAPRWRTLSAARRTFMQRCCTLRRHPPCRRPPHRHSSCRYPLCPCPPWLALWIPASMEQRRLRHTPTARSTRAMRVQQQRTGQRSPLLLPPQPRFERGHRRHRASRRLHLWPARAGARLRG